MKYAIYTLKRELESVQYCADSDLLCEKSCFLYSGYEMELIEAIKILNGQTL
jgi:hypothetical protein